MRLFAVSLCLSFSTFPTLAAQQDQDKAEEVERISVLGTRGTPRTLTDSPVAVDVFNAEELSSLGNAADLTDNLKSLLPSYTATPATGEGSAFIRPTSLRGLSPDQTLVLVNGKRRHRSALVQFFAPAAGNGSHGADIGMIPSIALESVDVLRDGAAAQYGSDAIAGVLNLRLKSQDAGTELVSQYGQYYEGENSWLLALNSGFSLFEDGFLNISAERKANQTLSRGVQRPDAQGLIDDGVAEVGQDSPFDDAPLTQTWGRPQTSGSRLVFNAGLPWGDNEVYAFGGYAQARGTYRFFYRPPDHPSLQQVTSLPQGYTPYLDGEQEDYFLVAGLKGMLPNDIGFDISAGYGSNQLDYYFQNTVNPGLAENGNPGQRDFDLGNYQQQETNLNTDFSWELNEHWFLGFGAEWRQEAFIAKAGEFNAWGVPPGPNGMTSISPKDAGTFKRNNYALYADLEHNYSDDLLLQYALRYEHFSDFGGTLNGKLAIRYQVADDWVMRGSASTGFHAPTPGQANVSIILTTFDNASGLQVEEGLVPPNHPDALASGGAPLKEEESRNFSLGLTYDGIEDSRINLDLYHIKVDDRIYRTGDIIAPGGNSISFYTNALDIEHQGLDLVITHRHYWRSDIQSQFTFAYNHGTTKVQGQASINGIAPVNDFIIEDIENNYPKDRWVLTALTDIDEQWQWMLRANFYGAHYDEIGGIDDPNNPSARVSPELFIDIELKYQFSEALKITLGAVNLFDNYVDRVGPPFANRLDVGLPYPRRSAANYEGGSWYLRANYRF